MLFDMIAQRLEAEIYALNIARRADADPRAVLGVSIAAKVNALVAA